MKEVVGQLRIRCVEEETKKDTLPATMACFSPEGMSGKRRLVFECVEMYKGKAPI